MRHPALRPLLLAALLGTSALANASDIEHGKTLFNACASCHGAQAQGNPALSAPVLAGQQASYLTRQLNNFRTGVRGSAAADLNGAQMKAMAATLADDQAIADVSDYLASLPLPSTSATLGGNAAQGSRLYQAKCGACHGGKAEGNPAMNTPRLTHQQDAYLQRQFQHFQQGIRGSEPSDRFGKQMKMMSATLNDSELLDVLAHINSLQQP